MTRERHRIPHSAASLVFLIGIAFAGALGTGASASAGWVACIALGIAGTFSIAVLFRSIGFSLPRWEVLLVLAATGYLLARSIDSPAPHRAREDVVLIALSFLGYACFLSICADWSSRKRLLFVLAGMVVLNLVVAAIQGLTGPRFWPWPGYERHGVAGVGGLFLREQAFGAFLAAFLPLWVGLAVFGRSARAYRPLWIGLAAASAGTIFAGGGGAMGGFALSVALLATSGLALWLLWPRLRSRTRAVALAVWVAAFLGGSTALIHPEGPRQSLLPRLAADSGRSDGRASLPGAWTLAWERSAEAPWSGAGSRSFLDFARSEHPASFASTYGEPDMLRNEYLQALFEYGAMGLLLVFGVAALHLGRGIRFLSGYRRNAFSGLPPMPRSDHLAVAFGAIGGLATMGASATFESLLHLPAFALAASLFLACLAAPDPMADALKPAPESSPLPNGALLIAVRSVAFGFGLSLVLFSALFVCGERHFAMAKSAFESDPTNFRRFRDLDRARKLDPVNPRALVLSARVQLAAIAPDASPSLRSEMLKRAEEFFAEARRLDPSDPFPAPAHAEVLDALGSRLEARQRLEEALESAPGFGFLHLALAEHHLRHGRVAEADAAYRASLAASVFRTDEASVQGLRSISEWKLIAASRGQRWEDEPFVDATSEGGDRVPPLFPQAQIEERAPAGKAPTEGGR